MDDCIWDERDLIRRTPRDVDVPKGAAFTTAMAGDISGSLSKEIDDRCSTVPVPTTDSDCIVNNMGAIEAMRTMTGYYGIDTS